MLLRANKFRKDKESDCRRNELGSRIFVGRVFVDYAKCLHFYPSFSYGRIIAGDRIATSRAESYQKIIICVLFVYGGTDFEPHYQTIDMVLLCSCS
mgnify:CR=1 FL=1